MKLEKEIKFLDLVRVLNRHKIRYLVIGRRAVILYGGPVLTADHDIWLHPEDKKKVLLLLSEKLDFELSHPPDTKRPIVTGFSGMKKYDLFFQRSVKNIENETIEFEDCYSNSVLKKDVREKVSFRIPSIDDLIRLKKIRKANVKDQQDIEYLLEAKLLSRKSKNS
ncbi:MAG: hypothetical protein A2V86_08110 [Deltaproteobacteria bacterium RBG_16_49_23]|nr:MAG: hypothetical protein A2V86_08110 [Deltaproteobacteria bacterium RBG_16_49_23]